MKQGTSDESDPRRLRGPGRSPRLHVEAGQRFGRGVVIDPDVRVTKRNLRGARLLCDCGSEYVGILQGILAGHQRSCGCLTRKNLIDRTGRRYGKLLVVQYMGIRPPGTPGGKQRALWLCKCDCGNETVVAGASLGQKKGTRSCGCSPKGRPKIPGERAARNRVLLTYKGAARSRGLSWELADDDFDRLMVQDCYYCGSSPSVMTPSGRREGGGFLHGGLDRKDNTLGYFLDNVVPCCIICNHAKMAMPYDDFMAWIARLIAHHWFNPEMTPSRRLKAVI